MLTPLHPRLSKPQPGDWLAEHDEKGQSFDAYVRGDPALPDLAPGEGHRRFLYVQPLGHLGDGNRRIVATTAAFMERFFSLEVRVEKPLPLSLVPASARRRHPTWGMEQLLTRHVLEEVMKPRLPDDAAAYISFTASDLWPGKGWNFVFGQAMLHERVGVWSVYRNGDPDKSDDSFRLALRRAMKIAVHETGHMFSIEHCTAHRCVMNGANSQRESDAAPMWLCPQCMAKITWATRVDPIERYERLGAFMDELDFEDESAFYRRSADALRGHPAIR